MSKLGKVVLIVKRQIPQPHYEVHKDGLVEFWALPNHKLGESQVEIYEASH